MCRICAIVVAACLLLSACETADSVAPARAGERPNFILVIVDDLRYDALKVSQKYLSGTARFPWVETPNLDQMAAEGAYFINAFVTTSLCSPSRASMLTGQYAHNHGKWDNSYEFNRNSFASELQKAGYQTAYFGKWHMGNQTGKRRGFDHSYSFVGQGEYMDAEFEVNGRPVASSGWVDHVSTQAMLDYLERLDRGDPFCMVLGFKSCHGPWDAPPEATKHLYQGPGYVGQSVPNLSSSVPYRASDEPSHFYSRGSYTSFYNWQDRNYFRYLSAIDMEMGRINERLEQHGLWDNTYLIFVSDNGFYMGEHGLRDKRTAYEESMRIPMLVKGPGIKAGNVCDELVLNLDIAPTILELANARAKWSMDGLSMKPLLFDQPTSWREEFIYEYRHGSVGPQVNILALRTDRYKLVSYGRDSGWNEFFDLTNDPYETNNLYDDASYAPELANFNAQLALYRISIARGAY